MTGTVTTGVSDMTSISDIEENGINNNLKIRYNNDIIYDHVHKYHTAKIGVADPHVFALVEAAYRSIVEDKKNQSCLISGESGAGKTESTKFVLQYLCAITSNVSSWIQQQILEANTILEAFGNAKTIRNDNSSRFGKFMQVCFDDNHSIKGCVIQDYLLEQSRITFQSAGERNYHVMYQLVAQGQTNKEIAETLYLRSPEFYRYLNSAEDIEIDINLESKRFGELTMAFTVLQIPQIVIESIFKVLSAILWLGNIEFMDIDGEGCDLSLSDREIVVILSMLLGLKADELIKVLLHRQINVRGNITEIPLKLHEAIENRHAMAKALYSKTFTWLVYKINSCTNPGQYGNTFLGVLDIFGFENFTKNSFEQLCINYTNEKLHKFFNHYVFALEQSIYDQEEINYTHVEFTDNSLCLELIEKPPRCVFKLLTEQCHMPKGSDAAYLTNLHTEFEYNPMYIKGTDRRHWETEFGIKHYAGKVIYIVDGFVDKNRDVHQDVLFDFMSRSKHSFLCELSKHQDSACSIWMQNGTTSQRGTGKTKSTVSDNFRQQLQCLIDVLHNTKLWYVRCIKPNTLKKPNDYNDSLVLDQLQYLGILDIIRIRKEGFPIHLNFEDFILKYKCLIKKRSCSFTRSDITLVLKELKVVETEWQIGKSKLFLRNAAYEPLEEARKRKICASSIIIQKNWRCYSCSKNYIRMRRAILIIQHACRGWKLRIDFLRKRRSVIVIQSRLRGVFAREVATALREMRRVDEEMKKREKVINDTPTSHCTDIEDCERLVQNEMTVLAHMAETLNATHIKSNDDEKTLDMLHPEDCNAQNADTVDLDNLFAFLTEATNTTHNQLFDEINSKMNDLVLDLDNEIEVCLQMDSASSVNNQKTSVSNETIELSCESTIPPVDKCIISPQKQTNTEPIYEALSNTEDLQTIQENISDFIKSNNTIKNSLGAKKKAIGQAGSSIHNDREQRRKFRVEKKLLEMHQLDTKKDVLNTDSNYNILEFAENFFNDHERLIDGTLISTLTRKGKKALDIIPKHEMIIFTRSEKIPTSHIHMYDPENIVISCNIFKELCKYMRGDQNAERELHSIQYIIGLGIEREELRDEIFVQCIRQMTKNPTAEWADRLWLLMCLIIVAFQPSKLLFRFFVSFLKQKLDSFDGKLRQYAQWCFDNCKCTKVSTRLQAPSSVEVAVSIISYYIINL